MPAERKRECTSHTCTIMVYGKFSVTISSGLMPAGIEGIGQHHRDHGGPTAALRPGIRPGQREHDESITVEIRGRQSPPRLRRAASAADYQRTISATGSRQAAWMKVEGRFHRPIATAPRTAINAARSLDAPEAR